MVDLKPSKGRAIVIDKKNGKPRSPDKTPKHFKVAKARKTARKVKAWEQAGKKTT